MIKECFIMRGLPGSGKSTFIKNELLPLHGKLVVCSADDYFLGPDGRYHFIKQDIGKAHKTCFAKFVHSIQMACPFVVVDNTNTTALEIEGYRRFADLHEYIVTILYVDAPFVKCMARQKHNVPFPTMHRMYHNLQQPLPDGWQVKWINSGW